MYSCDSCYKELDSYDYYKNDGKCYYCYYLFKEREDDDNE